MMLRVVWRGLRGALAVGALWPAPAGAEDLVKALPIAAPVRVDGEITPEEWAGADREKALSLDGGSRVWVLHAGSSLVFAVDARMRTQPAPAEAAKERRIEIALSDPARPGSVWVLSGAPDGQSTWAATAPGETQPQPRTAKGIVFRTVDRAGGHWTAECRIPFRAMGIRPAAGKRILLRIALNEAAAGTWATWPADAGRALDMGKAGALELPQVNVWEETILNFEAQDRKSMPPKDAVLFIGSSSIGMWPVAASFPDLKTIHRGFGGSQLPDSVHYFERIVRPYAPRVIVLYAGDNDVAAGRTPEQISADFDAFLAKTKRDLPGAHLVYIAIKPSPSRWDKEPLMRKANALIEATCAKEPQASYLDMRPGMLGADGQPRPELFLPDKLHMTRAGYDVWNNLLRKHLKEHTTCLP